MKYSIIIPCYNEAENVPDLINLLARTGTEFDIEWILVENGSKDNTREILDETCRGRNRFVVVYVNENQGYGYGLKQGMEKATGDYTGWLHADMQIAPDEIVKFIRVTESMPETRLFIKGKRRNRGFMDYFFTDCMTLYASVMLGTWIYDIGAIPVLFHSSLLEMLKITPYDFSIETYVYAMAKKSGFVVKRYDVVQTERKGGKSSWNTGFAAKIRQSKVIMKDISLIKKGKQVR